jgi:hypothetical protein
LLPVTCGLILNFGWVRKALMTAPGGGTVSVYTFSASRF